MEIIWKAGRKFWEVSCFCWRTIQDKEKAGSNWSSNIRHFDNFDEAKLKAEEWLEDELYSDVKIKETFVRVPEFFKGDK